MRRSVTDIEQHQNNGRQLPLTCHRAMRPLVLFFYCDHYVLRSVPCLTSRIHSDVHPHKTTLLLIRYSHAKLSVSRPLNYRCQRHRPGEQLTYLVMLLALSLLHLLWESTRPIGHLSLPQNSHVTAPTTHHLVAFLLQSSHVTVSTTLSTFGLALPLVPWLSRDLGGKTYAYAYHVGRLCIRYPRSQSR